MNRRLIWLTLAAFAIALGAATPTLAQKRDKDPIERASRTETRSEPRNAVEKNFDQQEKDALNDPVERFNRDQAIGEALQRENERAKSEPREAREAREVIEKTIRE